MEWENHSKFDLVVFEVSKLLKELTDFDMLGVNRLHFFGSI